MTRTPAAERGNCQPGDDAWACADKDTMSGSLPIIKIVARYLAGDSASAIARDAGVSRQRIAQVIAKAGVWQPGYRASLRKARHDARALARRARAHDDAARHHLRPRVIHMDHKGRWVTRGRFRTSRMSVVRAARWIAEQRLGRPVPPGLWCVYLDGDPHNLHHSNIAVMHPPDAILHRDSPKGGTQ